MWVTRNHGENVQRIPGGFGVGLSCARSSRCPVELHNVYVHVLVHIELLPITDRHTHTLLVHNPFKCAVKYIYTSKPILSDCVFTISSDCLTLCYVTVKLHSVIRTLLDHYIVLIIIYKYCVRCRPLLASTS